MENGSVSDVVARVDALIARLERDKAELDREAVEAKGAGTVVLQLAVAQRKKDSLVLPTMVPMFGGAAMLPAVLCAPGMLSGGLDTEVCKVRVSEEYYVRMDAEGAHEFIQRKLKRIQARKDAIDKRIEALRKNKEGLGFIAGAEENMKEEGVVEICEPITEEEEKVFVESARERNREVLGRRTAQGSDADWALPAFFRYMETVEKKWEKREKELLESGMSETEVDAEGTRFCESRADKWWKRNVEHRQIVQEPPKQPIDSVFRDQQKMEKMRSVVSDEIVEHEPEDTVHENEFAFHVAPHLELMDASEAQFTFHHRRENPDEPDPFYDDNPEVQEELDSYARSRCSYTANVSIGRAADGPPKVISKRKKK